MSCKSLLYCLIPSDQYEEQISALKKENDQLKEKYESEKSEWEKEKEDLLKDINKSQDTNAQLTKKIQQYEDIVECNKTEYNNIKSELQSIKNYTITVQNEMKFAFPQIQNAVNSMNTYIQCIPLLLEQIGKHFSELQCTSKESQLVYYSTESSIIKNKSNSMFIPVQFKANLLVQFLYPFLNFTNNFYIIGSSMETSTRLWKYVSWKLIERTFSAFPPMDVYAASITGKNELLVIHNNGPRTLKEIKSILKSTCSIGVHHYIQIRSQTESGTIMLSSVCISMKNEANTIDRGYTVLKELVDLRLAKSSILPFPNSELTKALQNSIQYPVPSVIIACNPEIEEFAVKWQTLLRNEKQKSSSDNEFNAHRYNALKNELFVMENDADAYEDEIRRLNRTIDEKNRIIASYKKT